MTARELSRISLQGRIVLGALAFFNALLLLALGVGTVMFVDGVAGPILGACLWFCAGALFALSRRLRKDTGWR